MPDLSWVVIAGGVVVLVDAITHGWVHQKILEGFEFVKALLHLVV